jgi:hypothetical protein
MNAVAAALEPIERETANDEAPESSTRVPSFKKCGCGKSYSRTTWEHLPRIGWMRGRREDIELRQCSCASTIAVLVSAAR